MVASVRTGRVQLCTGPGFTGPQSRCSRSAVAGSSPNRCFRSATASGAVAQALGAVVAAGQLDRRRQQHRLQRLLVASPSPPTAAAARCCGRGRCRPAGCSASARRAGCRPRSGMPMSSAITRSPPPGAQAPTQSASSRSPPATPAMPGPAEAGVAVAGVLRVEGLRRGDVLGLDLRHDDVVHDRGVVGRDLHAAHQLVGVEARVDQEAPVVVGAGGRGRLRGVGGGQPDALEPLALAQRRRP